MRHELDFYLKLSWQLYNFTEFMVYLFIYFCYLCCILHDFLFSHKKNTVKNWTCEHLFFIGIDLPVVSIFPVFGAHLGLTSLWYFSAISLIIYGHG